MNENFYGGNNYNGENTENRMNNETGTTGTFYANTGSNAEHFNNNSSAGSMNNDIGIDNINNYNGTVRVNNDSTANQINNVNNGNTANYMNNSGITGFAGNNSRANYMNNDTSANRVSFDSYDSFDAPAEKEKKKKKGSASGKIAAAAVCCAILGGGLGAGGTFLGMKKLADDDKAITANANTDSSSETNESTPAVDITDNSSSESESKPESSSAPVMSTANVENGSLMTAAEVYEKNVNSTVGITTSISTTNYFGYKTTSAASGSGFIISKDGYILTNHHVIEGANEITVTSYSGTQYKAKLVGSYAANDIAVLKIEADDLTPVTIGSSENLKVGNDVIAIGNPLGELTFSLTSGVVSALNREVTTEVGTMNLIQTDCAINSGNSGGALFNMYGEVVGITNAKYSNSSSSGASIDNIGFAIPIDQIKPIVASIIKDGYVVKPFIGVSVINVSSDMTAYGLPVGAVVKEIVKDSPAEKSDLKVNDIITKINGKEIKNSSELVNYIKGTKKGDKLKFTVYRSGETKEIEITVDEQKITSDNDNKEKEQEQQQNNQQQYIPIDPYMFGDFGEFFNW